MFLLGSSFFPPFVKSHHDHGDATLVVGAWLKSTNNEGIITSQIIPNYRRFEPSFSVKGFASRKLPARTQGLFFAKALETAALRQ